MLTSERMLELASLGDPRWLVAGVLVLLLVLRHVVIWFLSRPHKRR